MEIAAIFYPGVYGETVRKTEAALWLAAGKVMNICISRGSIPGKYAEAQQALAESDLERFFGIIRSAAATLAASQNANIFWRWVDAYGFYRDACGQQWPYMTDERRALLLEWAEEMACQIAEIEGGSDACFL